MVKRRAFFFSFSTKCFKSGEEKMDREQEIHEQGKKKEDCIPNFCCPEQLPSPQLPSPTDCLPPGVLKKVREEIRDANELLLDLASDDDRTSFETFQKVFDGLMRIRVEITNQFDETVVGIVTLVGCDFVVLKEGEVVFIFPFSQIEMVKPYGGFAEPYPEPKLSEADLSLLRDLTFNFGEIVASSPKLMQLFFRIRLDIYLRLVEGKRIKVKLNDLLIEGIVTGVNKETIVMEVNETSRIIPLDEISLITI